MEQVTRTTGFLSAILISLLVWNFFAGKDLSWDAINYHYYLPFSLLDGRVNKDFFPAGLQSYLNPVGLLPFYFLESLKLSSLFVSSVLVGIHFLNAVALLKIVQALKIFDEFSSLSVFLCVIVSLVCPIFLQLTGTSFIDSIVTVPFFFGLYYFLKYSDNKRLLVSGLLFGAAIGLKFVLLLFAAPLIVFFIARPLSVCSRQIASLVLGGALGFMIFGGLWFAITWKYFGSPIYPLYNAIFESPFFVLENIKDYKFLPESWLDVVLFPLELMSPESHVYIEVPAPDFRVFPFFLFLLVALFVHFSGVKKLKLPLEHARFLLYLLASYIIWSLFSSNGRYGLVFLLLVGVGLSMLLNHLFGIRRYSIYVSLIILLQVSLFVWNGQYRWEPRLWTKDWYEVNVPKSFQEEPALYLYGNIQTPSFLIPYLNSDSSFVNIAGQYNFDRESVSGQRILSMIDASVMPVKAIRVFNTDDEKLVHAESLHIELFERERTVFFEYDLDIVSASCEVFPMGASFRSIVICDLEKKMASSEYWLEKKMAIRVFSKIEASCPSLGPTGGRPVKIHGAWEKYYFSDAYYFSISGGHVYAGQSRSLDKLNLGQLKDYMSDDASVFVRGCPLDNLKKLRVKLL